MGFIVLLRGFYSKLNQQNSIKQMFNVKPKIQNYNFWLKSHVYVE